MYKFLIIQMVRIEKKVNELKKEKLSFVPTCHHYNDYYGILFYKDGE